MSVNFYGILKNREETLAYLKQAPSALLSWYDTHARVLPWRENRDPYRIWVSEIMLQQTRVEAVKPYYERFLSAFPDVHALAQAPVERVLKFWEGLGYYSRARNLHKAANQILQQYSGEFPRSAEELRTLSGIGEYTAGAIASIAYGQRVAAVDGNVLRVLSRLIQSTADITKAQEKKILSSLAQDMMPDSRAGDYNQAMMEIGALVCVPNGPPHCMECPLSGLCFAHRNSCEEEYPRKSPKKARRKEEKTVLLVLHGNKVLLHKRPEQGLLAGLWEFPMSEGDLPPQELLPMWGIAPDTVKKFIPAGQAKHIFSHVEWYMKGYLAWVSELPRRLSGTVWADKMDLDEKYPIAAAQKKYRAAILKLL